MIAKYEQIMAGAARWAGYYRANIHRFAHDYLHLDLHLFQKILLLMMNISVSFVFIGARGIGKTFLCAVFCVCRAILYPGSKICIASGTRGQALNILEKITLELVPRSKELGAEIDMRQSKINGTNAIMVFHNGSYIKVVTASDSARGNRANMLILDEFRLVQKDTIDTILRKFLTQRRSPLYSKLSKEERRDACNREPNKTLLLSSAYFADHWSYTKCLDTCRMMLDDRHNDFVCGLPYQLSISEGLLSPDTVADEMAESDFSEIKFNMEYGALWWGSDNGSFFDFNSISKNRKIKYPMYPSWILSKLNNDKRLSIPIKMPGEKRILSADIALMSSSKNNNDATAIFINQMVLTKAGRYTHNMVYTDIAEGLHTEDQALMIRKLYDEFDCDYIVIDSQGVGLGVFDSLVRDLSDPDTGEIYPALSCCNDPSMAERCTTPGAAKVIWAIKATAQMNSDCAVLLREGFRSGKIRLLMTEYDGDAILSEIAAYNKLPADEKLRFQLPYINTTLLIDETVKLKHEESNGRVRVYERTGRRKDRYSSLAYNYYVATQIETRESKRKIIVNRAPQEQFLYRAPKLK